jgi:methionine-rich copper-binding protein CopC
MSKLGLALIAGAALVASCTQTTAGPTAEPASAPPSESSILASSSPAAGSTVSGPVNNLELRFSPPARLTDVTISGPDGVMPAKVTAVGEVAHYSIPLAGLEPGSYTVNWKASAQGRPHQGNFQFTVR